MKAAAPPHNLHRGQPTARKRPLAPPMDGRAYAIAALLTGLALVLRLYRIDDQSYWTDELYTVIHIREGVGRIVAAGFVSETNPPLYYILLRGWAALFGDGEIATRSLSAILGALTVPVLIATGSILGSRRAGYIAALIFAAAVVEIEYDQETRQYALLALGLSVALLGLAQALARMNQEGTPPRRAGLLFAGGIVLAVYSQDVAVVYWLAMNLSLAACFFGAGKITGPKAVQFLRAWALYNAAAIVLVAPQLYAIAALRDAPSVAWIPYASWGSLLVGLEGTLFTHLPSPDSPAVLAGLSAASAAIIWAAHANRNRRLVMTLGLLLPVLAFASFVAISAFRPIMLIRTLIWFPVPLYLLVGFAIAGVADPMRRAAAIVVALAFAAAAMAVDWPNASKENWREAVRSVASAAGPGDIIGFFPDESSFDAFAYYWPGGFDAARCRVLAEVDQPPTGSGSGRPLPACERAGVETLVRGAVEQGHALWLVARGLNIPGLVRFSSSLPHQINVRGRQWVSTRDSFMIVRIGGVK